MKTGDERPAVLFDLDGTLTDPFVGITNGIRHALTRMGRTPPPAQDLRVYIGPPLSQAFAQLLETDDAALIAEAVGLYRERYQSLGKFENALIPGIVEALERCVDSGYFLSVATSKLESYSRDILDHFDLMRFFDAVHGSAPDGGNADKSDLIAHILEVEPVAAARAAMVGDRRHDVAGAAANAMPAVGVLWGFGARAELEEAGAAALVERPDGLARALSGVLGPQPA